LDHLLGCMATSLHWIVMLQIQSPQLTRPISRFRLLIPRTLSDIHFLFPFVEQLSSQAQLRNYIFSGCHMPHCKQTEMSLASWENPKSVHARNGLGTPHIANWPLSTLFTRHVNHTLRLFLLNGVCNILRLSRKSC